VASSNISGELHIEVKSRFNSSGYVSKGSAQSRISGLSGHTRSGAHCNSAVEVAPPAFHDTSQPPPSASSASSAPGVHTDGDSVASASAAAVPPIEQVPVG